MRPISSCVAGLCGVALATSVAAAAPTGSGAASPAGGGYYTYHSDNLRTGWNPHETTLTAAAVASTRFGRLRYLPADGVVYAQPLYVPHLATAHGTHNAVIIATENDSVYAYDSDDGTLLWKRSFTDAATGVAAVTPQSAAGCNSITPTIGVSSTPVIDPSSNALYVVDKVSFGTGNNMTFHNQIHKMRLSDGSDLLAPVEIGGTVTAGDGTPIPFFSQQQINRPGLALANGQVYVAFGSDCDIAKGAVHGWMFAYDAATLAKRAMFNTTNSSAETYLGSIWQSTVAPAIDERGNIFFSTGNGSFDADKGSSSYAESVLRLDPSLHVSEYFAPRHTSALTIYDQDVSSVGVVLVPQLAAGATEFAIAGEKDGIAYVLDRNHLGGYDAQGNHALQALYLNHKQNALYGVPAYYNGNVYWGGGDQPLIRFSLSLVGGVKLVPVTQSANTFPGEGGTIPIVSSNGTQTGSAVVWATTRVAIGGSTFDLYAYDALTMRTLYHTTVGTWLSMGDAFLTPTVAGGHVFVPGAYRGVIEYGLH